MSHNPRLFSFIGGLHGPWKTRSIVAVCGAGLAGVERLEIVNGGVGEDRSGGGWVLRGVTSNERYATRSEKDQLVASQPALGRTEADCAALIPIRKSAAWWALTQDERRRVFEERSQHTQIGLDYLPAVARRLHHCRDLATAEPFDFLTWFEFARKDSDAFNQLLQRLRATEEWRYVEREVEIRFDRVT